MTTFEIITPALIASILTAAFTSIIAFYRERLMFKREMIKQTHFRILEKAEKAVGFHFTYYTKLIEMQKVFEVMSVSLNNYPGNAEGLEAVIPKLQEIAVIISKLQNEYQIDANSIFLYIKSDVINDWYDSKIEELIKCMVQFKAHQNSFDENLAEYRHSVEMELSQQDDIWNKVVESTIIMQKDISQILIILKGYIQNSKDIVEEIRKKVPKEYLKSNAS